MTPRAVDFDLHGVVRVRVLDADPADEAKVARQLGLPAVDPEGEADLVLRFVDAVTHQPLTYVGLGDTGFNGDGFFVLAGPGSTTGRTRIPFDELGARPEILCERHVLAVPHLLTMINLAALSKDVLPLHASAFTLGGVSGNAGLFSTATDLAIFAQMMVNRGTYEGKRLVADSTVRRFTTLQAGNRTYGWMIASGEQGSGEFLSETTYGHAGYTGTSLWIDPDRELFVIILTNRVHPDDKGNVSRLRREVANAVAAAVGVKD